MFSGIAEPGAAFGGFLRQQGGGAAPSCPTALRVRAAHATHKHALAVHLAAGLPGNMCPGARIGTVIAAVGRVACTRSGWKFKARENIMFHSGSLGEQLPHG